MEQEVIQPTNTESFNNKILKSYKIVINALSLLLFLALVGLGLLLYQNQKLAQQMARLQEKKPANSTTQLQESDQAPLVFEEINLGEVSDDFKIDIRTLTKNPTKPVSCLVNSQNPSDGDFSNLAGRVSDPNVISFSREIENRLYPGYSVTDEKSRQDIVYREVCTLNGTYFFMYTTISPDTGFVHNLAKLFSLDNFTVQAAGGAGFPRYFAYSNDSGKLTILENFPPDAAHLKLPPSEDPEDFSIPTSTYAAYYSCGNIYIANNLEVFVGCGGGDGPAGGGGIFRVDLTNQKVSEKTYCSNTSLGKYATRCYDEKGKVYYEELNNPQKTLP